MTTIDDDSRRSILRLCLVMERIVIQVVKPKDERRLMLSHIDTVRTALAKGEGLGDSRDPSELPR